MIDFLVYIAYKIFEFKVKVLPKSLMKYGLITFAKLIYILDTKHKKIAMVNLNLAYENTKTLEEKKEIIKQSYQNLVFNLYEFVENQYLTLEQLEEKIKVENEYIIKDAIKSERKIILISAHYGNWEVIGSYNSMKYKPMTNVGRPMSNEYLNDDLRKSRNLHKSEMLDKHEAAKGLIKALKADRMIGLVVDQNTSDNMGLLIDFFGKKARQTDSPAKLALKFNALIIPVFVIKNDFRDYTIKYCEPIDINKIEDDDKILKCTQLQADAIEEQIKNKPEDWFWQHQRWKNQYEELYK
ncbi:MAG: lipid A biosynthesis acyltransferase [Arcobacteraceae bacterium]|nr:lipid A biosynthesis acyltransferase [Arcobacteraceae bacterium]